MPLSFNTADVKARLSEMISKVAYGSERLIVLRRGKPVAALVSSCSAKSCSPRMPYTICRSAPWEDERRCSQCMSHCGYPSTNNAGNKH